VNAAKTVSAPEPKPASAKRTQKRAASKPADE
jgi:hypothetical protein